LGKHFQDVPGKVFFDLTMTRHGLRDFGGRILIPIVFAAVADESATRVFNPFD
jgi:hypothetical protein